RVVGAGGDREQRPALVGLRVPHAQVPLGVDALHADLRPVDLAVLGDVHADRALQVGLEHGAGEVRPHGAAAVGVAALCAGDPLDAADQVLHQVVVAAVLAVGGGEVAEARGPD